MATLPKTKTLALSLDAGWLTVWFNQPERRNPLTDEAVEDLAAVIESIKDQRDIRGMTIRGKGGFFCAGAISRALMRWPRVRHKTRCE